MQQDMYLKALTLYLLTWVTAALNFSETKAPNTGGGSISSIFLPIDGNVYPKGYYTATISIGSKSYVLDIDTGSDITWVKCVGQGVQPPYYNPQVEPGKINVSCKDPECKALGAYGNSNSGKANDPCKYNVNYADGGSSNGALFKDSFPFRLRNGTTVAPKLAFGCGYPKPNEQSIHQPLNGGILGLGKGASGILKQLSNTGAIRNVVGHCLSSNVGGFISFGDDFLPKTGIVWKQLLGGSEHYSLGSADLLSSDGKLAFKGLQIIFDSGSTYTYFNSQAYGALLDLINNNLIKGSPLKVAKDDNALPVCWKGPKKFQSIVDVASYFKPFALRFAGVANVLFPFSPIHYLIISKPAGNVCLGILNGTQVGLRDMNVIGDISMQDKFVLYDNENGRIGWVGVSGCKRSSPN